MRRRRRRKRETAKVILIFVDTLISISLIVLFYLKYLALDLSDIAPVECAVIGLATVAHGFYYWKAKAENMIKLGLTKDYFNLNSNNEFNISEGSNSVG